MAYVAPGIDENGIHVPEYEDTKQRLLDKFRAIFGDDLYLGEDTQDYQMIAEIADVHDDICSLAVELYASRNPDFATGVSLDYMLPLNGIRRLLPTFSTVVLTASGTPGTVISAGSLAQDVDGRQWATDAEATIPASGSVDIPATCTVSGAIHAVPGAISQIMSPTAGWIAVSNADDAVPGRNRETDAEAHARRNASVSNRALSLVEAIKGVILTLEGVTKARVYENKEHTTDANGITPNSVCAVVQNGNSQEIAEAIFNSKGPGCGTYGNTTVIVKDVYEQDNSIKFSRPADKAIAVNITVKRLDGFSDGVTDHIKANVKAFIDALEIGTALNVGLLYSCVLAVNDGLNSPICAPVYIAAGVKGGTMQTDVVPAAYADNMTCATADVTVTVTA